MLQGSLDNFALDEVLGLLSSTSKTGKLDLKSNRGNGSLRLLSGRLVDAGASNAANGTEPEDILFELLRYGDGTFSFTSSELEEGDYSTEVVDVLSSAERRLADWRTIEVVVPSLRHQVAPVPTLPEEEVTISRQEWSVLITVAGGCPVSTVCDELGLGEVEGSRQIKGLAERGLVTIGPPKTGTGFRRAGVDALRTAGIDDPLRRHPEPVRGNDESVSKTEEGGVVIGDGSEQVNDPKTIGTPAGNRPSRPPHPEDSDGRSNRVPAAAAIRTEGTGNGEAGNGQDDETPKSGGLLMRYLKSDD